MRCFLFVLAIALFAIPACRAEDDAPPAEPLTIISADDGRPHDFTVEIAATPDKRTIGLMFRKSMPPDAGMLFLFDDEVERGFWMRNTFIPLDIIFIRRNGTISHIHANAIPHDETRIPSNGPAFSVLEINGGRAAELGLKPGDRVHHTAFGNALAKTPSIH